MSVQGLREIRRQTLLSYKEKEVVDSHDYQRPERTWHITEDN